MSPLPKEKTAGAGTCPRSLGHHRASPARRDQNPIYPVDSKCHVATGGRTEEGRVGGSGRGLEPS